MKTVRDVVTPTAPSADISVTQTDSPDPVTVGGNVTYTLKVRNLGTNPAAAVTLSDTLPAGLTFVSRSTTQGTCSGTTTVTCNIGTVNPGAANEVTVTIVAATGQAAVPSVTNTATVTTSSSDSSSANNQASAATTVNPAADLSLTNTDSPDPITVGGNVTYTMVLRNNGPSPAAGVTVSDPLPAGLTKVSATSTKGTCSGTTTISCSLGTVNAGAANDVTITIVATAGLAAVPSVTNTATASSSTGDPSAANNQASAATTVNPSADLQITQETRRTRCVVGGNVTYTLTLRNNGPSPAAGVTVSDALPAGLTHVSTTTTGGTCSGTATVTCNLGTVNAGAANDVTITIVASVGQAAVPSVTNTASASSSTGDPTSANNQASAATTVNPSADLQITATDAPDPVFVAGNVTYTLTVRNNGPSPAAGVTVSDSLPAALTLVSTTSTNGTCSGTTTVSCAIGTINAGAANDVTITIVATASQAAVPSVTNTATASSSTGDPSAANNQASAATTVNPSADVQITATDAPDPVLVGGNVTYTLTLRNNGPSPAAGVTVSDALPAGLTHVSTTTTKGACSGTATVSCNLGTVNAGAANDVTVTIVASVGQAAVPSVTNTASAWSSTADPTGSNNQAGATTTVTPSADVSLSKTSFPGSVHVGDDVVYTLALHNAGPSPAAGVSVSDPLPASLTLVSATSTQGTCSGTTTVSCAIGTIDAGAAHDVSVTIVARAGVNAAPGVTNTATVSASTADPTAANNEASASTTVNPLADLQITAADAPDPVNAGGNVTYTLAIHNAGPSTAAATAVTDALPSGLSLVSATPSQGSCAGTATVTCDLGAVEAGAAHDVTVTIVATAGHGAVPGVTNSATVSSSTNDPLPSNNEAGAHTTVEPSADVQVSKSDGPDPVVVGHDLTYTLSVHNAGPSPAAAVSVSDALPEGLSLVSATSSQGSCAGVSTITCDLGTVGAGAASDVTVTIVATVGPTAAPSVTNIAGASSTTHDPSASNNQASVDTTVSPSADLQLSQSDSPDPVQTGDDLTYSLTVHNDGPSPASGVSVSDPVPSGVTLVSATPSQGTCAGTATVSCDLGTVAAGAAHDVTVTIIVRPEPGAVPSITNTATVSSSTSDPSPGNDRATVETTVTALPAADLQLSKSDAPDPVQVGADVIYTVTVHNAGPEAASEVTVSDPLPAGLSLVAATSTQGTCSGTDTITCTLNTVNAGPAHDVTITIIATAGEASAPSVTNTATVSSATADPNSSNNEAAADTTVNRIPAADLQLSTSDSPDPVEVGGDLTYTLTAHNDGPDTATAVNVFDQLPVGVTLVSATASQGTCSGTATLTCDLDSLAAGAANDATVTIVVRADEIAMPTVTNMATVTSMTGDPSMSNNTSGTETTVEPQRFADLSLQQSDAPDPVEAGNDVTYTLTVHNDGPDRAAGVTVSDPLPAGLSLVSATPSQGTCAGTSTVVCDLGTVEAGAAHDVTVTIVATAGHAAVPSVTNMATVSAGTADPSAANNEASVDTIVDPAADLQLSKTGSPDPVTVGDDVTYTLTVHNAGPSPAAAVSVSDALPAGLSLVSAVSARGTCTGTATIACDLGTVDPGAAHDVTITIVATAGEAALPAVTNTAAVSSTTADPNSPNNEASAATTVQPPPSADLQLSIVDAPDPVEAANDVTYTLTVHNDGPDAAAGVSVSDPLPAGLSLVSAAPSQGSCAGTDTVTCDLGAVEAGAAHDVTVTIVAAVAPGTGPSITNTAGVSSSTPDPTSANDQASTDTTVSAPSGYPRPKGATPLRVALVPAHQECVAANSAHGPPLAHDSCSPPLRDSGELTIGSPDSNGVGANSSGSVTMKVVNGSTSTSADEADVTIAVSLTDVRRASDLGDYGGELSARARIRLTDRLNSPGGADAGTVSDFDLGFAVPCTPTVAPGTGSICSVTTTADAVTPGMVVERARSVWELGRIALDDGGPDGLAATDNNETFAVQGVFVP